MYPDCLVTIYLCLQVQFFLFFLNSLTIQLNDIEVELYIHQEIERIIVKFKEKWRGFCLMNGDGEGASVTVVGFHRDVTVFPNYP